MNHDIPGLETKLRGIKRCLPKSAVRAPSTTSSRSFTNLDGRLPAEFSFVSAMADSLQRQLDTASAHFSQLRDAASKVGKP